MEERRTKKLEDALWMWGFHNLDPRSTWEGLCLPEDHLMSAAKALRALYLLEEEPSARRFFKAAQALKSQKAWENILRFGSYDYWAFFKILLALDGRSPSKKGLEVDVKAIVEIAERIHPSDGTFVNDQGWILIDENTFDTYQEYLPLLANIGLKWPQKLEDFEDEKFSNFLGSIQEPKAKEMARWGHATLQEKICRLTYLQRILLKKVKD